MTWPDGVIYVAQIAEQLASDGHAETLAYLEASNPDILIPNPDAVPTEQPA